MDRTYHTGIANITIMISERINVTRCHGPYTRNGSTGTRRTVGTWRYTGTFTGIYGTSLEPSSGKDTAQKDAGNRRSPADFPDEAGNQVKA